ncbi:unnamed protein product [Meganyctiphanes norvegica]|uniref:Metalloendopeptidase n=1 Tax=Meganyctiphanes norvegica TaxID=48144 RepID=A0AAV2PGN5_MEGNR
MHLVYFLASVLCSWAVLLTEAKHVTVSNQLLDLSLEEAYKYIKIGDPVDDIKDLEKNIGAPLSDVELADAGRTSKDLATMASLQQDSVVDPITLAGLYQGDIIISSKEKLRDIILSERNLVKRSAVSNRGQLWPNGVIPYTISSDFGRDERRVIAGAMAAFQQKTCLSFVARGSQHREYVHIYKGDGCSSQVGRAGGRQGLSLGWGCVQHGTVLHEFMHAAGFWHEQSRYDRDDYVKIIWENVIPHLAYNFNKHTSGTTDLGLPYDYNSLMHYGAHAFAQDRSRPTIVPKKRGVSIGNRRDFSKYDIEGLNRLYQCNEPTPASTPAPKPEPTPAPKPEPTPAPPSSCKDKDQQCPGWTSRGECHGRHSRYMNKFCKKSCNVCDEDKSCQDKSPTCSWWAQNKECQRNPSYMLGNCRKSCGVCG